MKSSPSKLDAPLSGFWQLMYELGDLKQRLNFTTLGRRSNSGSAGAHDTPLNVAAPLGGQRALRVQGDGPGSVGLGYQRAGLGLVGRDHVGVRGQADPVDGDQQTVESDVPSVDEGGVTVHGRRKSVAGEGQRLARGRKYHGLGGWILRWRGERPQRKGAAVGAAPGTAGAGVGALA